MSNKQVYGFGQPITDILATCATDSVYLFWKDKNHRLLGLNELEGKLLCKHSHCPNPIGKNGYDLQLYPEEINNIEENEISLFQNDYIKFFIESCFGVDFLSIKSSLKNSANRYVGTIGLSFCPSSIPLTQILRIVNQLNLKTQHTSSFFYNAIINNDKLPLTKREKECAYYISKCFYAKEIANQLNISTRTVESHIASIKQKLNCNSRSQIVSKILEDTEQ